MGSLFRTPEGFLDLTGQRVGGRYPTAVSDAVAPTIDLLPLIGSRLIASEVAPSLTSAVGDSVTIEVPDNEVWLLFQVSWSATPTATNRNMSARIYLTNMPGANDPANQLPLSLELGYAPTGLSAVHTYGRSSHFPNTIALPAGVVITAEITDTNHTTSPWSLQAGFYRLTGN